ncbi:hypothetical protein HYDPIDRAFT_102417 [Hydnomerulius pinastri MD-312]|uniref:DUF6589 domain-containing protein n=1 Tax=Hydnomerulius pinastri MD-312 TaxID=994086 RepID=A0A0C9UZW3_9AGAM|nr:hypothetical protein HYDPIDRAFT_102417 [Hydnomerulius pinastri MD-312]
MLVNPTGKVMKWQAVDWCVELNNLFTKVKNGGKGPNRTVERIFLESPLVQVYRNVQSLIQKNFDHTHLTTRHGDPDMTKTFDVLRKWLAKNSLHVVSPGRKSQYGVQDLFDKGREMMEKAAHGEAVDEDEGNDEGEGRANMEDVIVELV